jgi:hypothetical protein
LTNTLVLFNGSVFTADRDQPWAEAIAIRDGSIEAVGRDASIRRPEIDEIDLGGRTVVPGFIDAHNHYLATGEMLANIDVKYPKVGSVDDLVEVIAGAAADTPAGEWINATGFDHAKYGDTDPPTRWDLDRATGDHPVTVLHISGHYVLVNSAALEACDLNEDTRDPQGGELVRDEHGRITGLCLDAAMGLVLPVAVDIGSHGPNFHVEATLEELVAAVGRAGRAFVAAGLTTVCDAQVTSREFRGYREAYRRGDWWVRTACMPLSHQLNEYGSIGLAGPFGNDEFWLGAIKFYADGSLIGGTAAFWEPYGEHGEFGGSLFWEEDELRTMIVEAHSQGWQVGVHAQGDRAIDATLDAFEAAGLAHPRTDARHRIEHAGCPTPDQIHRMADLGVIAVNQPGYLYDSGDEFLERLGERAHMIQPFRAELDAGVTVVLSSDSDVASFRPLDTISAALRRKTIKGFDIGTDQTLTIEEAVRAHTIDAAYALFAEDRLGSIEPGKHADLVVIDGDLFRTPPEEIPDLPIWKTMIGGRVVYDGA